MNKSFATSFTLIAALTAQSSFAAEANHDYYLGAALATKGTMTGSTSSSLPFRLYGGFALNDQVAYEVGYTSFGVFKYSQNREIALSALTLAAKGTLHITDSWTAFGKVGAARHVIDVKGTGLFVREQNKVTPMLGVGVGYKVTPKLTLDMELVSYGKIKLDNGQLTYRTLQLGANYSF